MNIVGFLFKLFLLYLLYKLIFDFIIPVYKTTKQMKSKISEMQQRMKENQAAADPVTHPQAKPAPNKDFQKDYIDYEEIK